MTRALYVTTCSFPLPSLSENTTNYWHIHRTLAISNGVVYCYGRVSIMTAAKAALNLLLLVAVLLGGQQRLVSSAPIVRSPTQDVELLDRDSADGDVIIQGSMITPFPPAATGAANEPNFFWSGSGDDPDAGMTYWITTTVVKTTLVTLSPPPTPSPSSPTTTTTTERVEPTPVLRVIPDESAVDWPREASLPEYWLRTVFRTDRDDEQSPNFRHLLQSGLKRLYANSDVRLVNITRDRSSNDGQTVQVVYALLSLESRQIVEPHEAVSSLRAMTNVNVTRQLCHGTGDTQKQDVLCQSIVTRAEPFAIVTASASSTQSTTYWIIGTGLAAAIILILLIVLLVCFVQRQKQQQQQQKKKNTSKEDRATSPALALASNINTARSNVVATSGDSRVTKESSNSKSADKMKKLSSGLQRVEEDPDPLVRKARSTSKKKNHATVAGRKNSSKRKAARPLTAPAGHNSSRQSCSSLSAVASGSSSLASSVDYRLPREEPVQVSRGARRLKHKSKTRTNHHHNNNNDSLKSHEQSPRRPVPKPRRLLPAVETETQEITADFSLTPDEESIDGDSAPIPDPPQPQYRWRPGSLIPSRVSGAIFSSRKVSSAPGERQSSVEPLPRRAWVSSSPIITTSIAIDRSCSSRSSRNINDLSPALNKLPLPSPPVVKPPPLHIHSISFPGLGIGADTDPATELIRSIKQELKKFDHQVH